eukprot:g74.t1
MQQFWIVVCFLLGLVLINVNSKQSIESVNIVAASGDALHDAVGGSVLQAVDGVGKTVDSLGKRNSSREELENETKGGRPMPLPARIEGEKSNDELLLRPESEAAQDRQNEVMDDLSKLFGHCNPKLSCSLCVAVDGCGFCQTRLKSGDGSVQSDMTKCMRGDASGPLDDRLECSMWNYNVCRCVNDCSGKGTCDVSSGATVCDCFHGYEGVDCSKRKPPHKRPEVMVPLAFVLALTIVSLFVVGQVCFGKCFDQDDFSAADKFDEDVVFDIEPNAQETGDGHNSLKEAETPLVRRTSSIIRKQG